MERKRLIELGFKEVPFYTRGNKLIYSLERNRELSLSDLGNPNELLSIKEFNENDIITDNICLHNYDDCNGYLTEEKLTLLLNFFAAKN